MPELPEVETTRRGIAPWLDGSEIRHVKVHDARLRWPVPTQISALRNLPVKAVARRAKYLLIHTEQGTLLIHLGMSGSLRVCDASTPRRKHDHVEFFLSNDNILRLHDPRRFGCVLWDTDDGAEHPLLSQLGPEPLGEDFHADYLKQALKGRKAAVKNLIMNNHSVVGVGNIYAAEALYRAGIRPGRAGARVSLSECVVLVSAIKEVLGTAIRQGGTTLRDFVNSDGQPGYFAQSLNVYGRSGEPCHHCDGIIKSKTIGQRASCYCPQCQR